MGEEERLGLVGVWRDSVLWFLRRGLEGVGECQRGMMERRLEREVERGRSVLYKVRGSAGIGDAEGEGTGMGGGIGGYGAEGAGGGYGGKRGVEAEDESRREIEQQLSPEQLQLFAQENQDMLKQYEGTLDQVRYVNSLPPLTNPPFS